MRQAKPQHFILKYRYFKQVLQWEHKWIFYKSSELSFGWNTKALCPPWLENPTDNCHANTSLRCPCRKTYCYVLMNPTVGYNFKRKQVLEEEWNLKHQDMLIKKWKSHCCLVAPLIKEVPTIKDISLQEVHLSSINGAVWNNPWTKRTSTTTPTEGVAIWTVLCEKWAQLSKDSLSCWFYFLIR